jgi:hypothetical protein
MKAQTLAKRTIVPHDETRLTMKHAPQKLVPSFPNQEQFTRVSR